MSGGLMDNIAGNSALIHALTLEANREAQALKLLTTQQETQNAENAALLREAVEIESNLPRGFIARTKAKRRANKLRKQVASTWPAAEKRARQIRLHMLRTAEIDAELMGPEPFAQLIDSLRKATAR